MIKKIVLAGGCFWGAEAYFERLKGVLDTRVGYAQSNVPNPSYREVCSGATGAVEAVEVTYDGEKISLSCLIQHLFRFIDPTLEDRQGNDVGPQYQSGVYASDDEDFTRAQKVLASLQPEYDRPILTECELLRNFYPAEEYHQRYLDKNPGGYCHVDLSLLRSEERKEGR